METDRRTTSCARLARLLVLGITAGTLAMLAPTSASAATAHPHVGGKLGEVKQDSQHILTVSGWALDTGHTTRTVVIKIVADGKTVGRVRTGMLLPNLNSRYKTTGKHGFVWAAKVHRAKVVQIWAFPAGKGEHKALIAQRYMNGYRPSTAGQRIIAEARKHVGQAYVYGAAGPTAFDCSGLTSYVYRKAGVASLPHSAEAQRETVRLIPRSQARAGDLIFFLSGGSAYHVAIYAGSGRDYAAVDEAEGVKYQALWSNEIQFGTTWH